MVVIEDEVKLALQSGHLVEESCGQCLDLWRLGRAQRGQDALPESLLYGPQRGHQVGEETYGIVVVLVQRHPAAEPAAGRAILRPFDQQGRLTKSRWGRDEGQLSSRLMLQLFGQSWPRDQLRTRHRWAQFGGHERIDGKWHLAHLR